MTEKKILITWFGGADLAKSISSSPEIVNNSQRGPVYQAASDKNEGFTDVYVLHGYSTAELPQEYTKLNMEEALKNSDYFASLMKFKGGGEAYVKWLKKQLRPLNIHIDHKSVELFHANDLKNIYKAARETVDNIIKKYGKNCFLTFHLSPGTPSMAFAWTCIAMSIDKKIELIAISDRDEGIKHLELPFKLKVEKIVLPKNVKYTLFEGIDQNAFNDIIKESDEMKEVINEACINAQFKEPILILGETGVGKTLLAEAIHKASNRTGEFISKNCSAVPKGLLESELFGHKKGSFTGADKDKDGAFVSADNGTIFLDEIGEISKDIQVKLLTGPLEGIITPIGGVKKIIDVNIITATNRNLNEEVALGNFRSDLFYRLAVGVINIPPFRLRKDDLEKAIDKIISELNIKFKKMSGDGWPDKDIEKEAKAFITKEYKLSGNYRELKNILYSAFKNSYAEKNKLISIDSVKKAIKTIAIPNSSTVKEANKDLNELLTTVISDNYKFKNLSADEKKDLINKALCYTKNNKDQTAGLLKISRQALYNNLEKYNLA